MFMLAGHGVVIRLGLMCAQAAWDMSCDDNAYHDVFMPSQANKNGTAYSFCTC